MLRSCNCEGHVLLLVKHLGHMKMSVSALLVVFVRCRYEYIMADAPRTAVLRCLELPGAAEPKG